MTELETKLKKHTDSFYSRWLRMTYISGVVMTMLGAINLYLPFDGHKTTFALSLFNIGVGTYCLIFAAWLLIRRPVKIRASWAAMTAMDKLLAEAGEELKKALDLMESKEIKDLEQMK